MEATYSFTIPSLHDDIPLDCRIYHPSKIQNSTSNTIRGAIVGHPYAPLGGSYDDNVVLSVTESLLDQGYIVITFNFRGGGNSAGKTSWTGRPEIDDFCSIIGLLVYYARHLDANSSGPDTLSFVPGSVVNKTPALVGILLAGYSFASLILCRLPAVSTVLKRFENAEIGTNASEIFMRARTLAKQTRQSTEAASATPTTPRRGRGLSGSPVVVGGEETDASSRRRSRGDSRGSVEVIREVPRNIKSHLHRPRSGQFLRNMPQDEHDPRILTGATESHPREDAMKVRYLLISPVLLPLTTTLVPPGLPFTAGEETSGVLSQRCPTLIIFGSADTFSSSKKLRQWAERLENGQVRWTQIEGAGHFWREKSVMRELLGKVREWTAEERDGEKEGGILEGR